MRIDPPITVESAEPEPFAEPARRPECAHRLTWRELTGPARLHLVLQVLSVCAVLAAAAALLTEAATALRGTLLDHDPLRYESVLTAVTGALLPIGPIAMLRLWQRPHRPASAAHFLFSAGLGMTMCLAVATRNEWLALAALPAYSLTQELGKFRRVLTDRATCASDPALPFALRFRTGELDLPADDTERAYLLGPRLVIGDFDSWSCPHLLTWGQIRFGARVRGIIEEVAFLLYQLGLAAAIVAILANADHFTVPVPSALNTVSVIVIAAGAGYLHRYVRKVRSVGPHRHFALTYRHDYLLAFAATASGATVAGWAALALDRPYLWLTVPFALYCVYGLVENLVVNTPISQCKARPELHPIVQSWKKA
ncbi:hypothetical protein SAMN05216298_3592 [Glycomyces sambucus]|uniref:Uncharacterized protein n=1 Tax=Glycomyces sambucus TaxID=380244 RepID=A0A1G9JEM0_9ACTN|nr:hypothetical protein [Glycomyces sambucus]SDL35811.1 hypothetical protein SAMN05216298_3592 [Glycomyces sambucus]